jgi:hypothetical protein
MIIYVNIDKQTGNITVNNNDYPDDPTIFVVNSGTIVDNSNNTNFEISFKTTRWQELETPVIEELPPPEDF